MHHTHTHSTTHTLDSSWFSFVQNAPTHPSSSSRCLQNYIPAHSLTLSCPVCRQTSILPEKGVAALQNNFFITNLMDVLQREPGSCGQEAAVLNNITTVATGQLLSCPNHGGNVRVTVGYFQTSRAINPIVSEPPKSLDFIFLGIVNIDCTKFPSGPCLDQNGGLITHSTPYVDLMFTFLSLLRSWSSTVLHVRPPCVRSVPAANTENIQPFLWRTSWNSTRPRSRTSWTPSRRGNSLLCHYMLHYSHQGMWWKSRDPPPKSQPPLHTAQ